MPPPAASLIPYCQCERAGLVSKTEGSREKGQGYIWLLSVLAEEY